MGNFWTNDLVLFLKGLLEREGIIGPVLGLKKLYPRPHLSFLLSESAVGKTVSDGRVLEGGRTDRVRWWERSSVGVGSSG